MNKLKYRSISSLIVLLLAFASLNPSSLSKAAPAPVFNTPAFATNWQRVDLPVQELPDLGRGYTWGPVVDGSQALTTESYNGASRQVQYFDKARMEINQPEANSSELFYITTGLLVKELVTGLRQDGDTTFTQLAPSTIPVAGDPNDNGANPVAPTYASFQKVVTFTGNQNGQPRLTGTIINSRIDLKGTISQILPPENRFLTGYDDLTQHNIADVFVDFGNRSGLVWKDNSSGGYVQDSIFFGNPTYVLGRPVTEPYWTRARVSGIEKDVLVQLFERRVLTYTPANSPAYQVEMGNVGQHYFKWRYPNIVPSPAPNLPVPASSTPVIPFGVDALLNLYHLPQLGAYTQTYEVSSHDPAAKNHDYGNYLYHDNTGYVLFDSIGTGAIYRLWMTNPKDLPFETIGRIQFYFDNEATPRLDLAVTEFFSGKFKPFVTPLVGDEKISSGGYFCYVPITYASRLKIVTTGQPGYYQFNYQKLSGVQSVKSFTGQEDYSRLINLLSNPGQDPKPANPARQTLKGDSVIKAGSEVSLGLLKGPGVISAFKLKLDAPGPALMSDISIRIKWDERALNQVDAPLDYFFGSGNGEKRVEGLMAGIDPVSHRYYFYFPMPFHSSARISLFNSSGKSVPAHWEIGLDSDPAGKLVNTHTGYFNATFKQEKETPQGQDYVLLNTTGQGRYVGTVMHIYSHISAMEGNERVYIDGSSTPQQYGTGFEDYFNGAWGFNRGPFTLPLHGSADKAVYQEPAGFVDLLGYRFLLGDAITFSSSLRVSFEQGYIGHNQPVAGQIYSSLALWYSQESNALEQSDALEVGATGTEHDHAYTNSGKVWQGDLTSSYEGINNKELLTDNGYQLQGGSEFSVNINPENAGVLVRRRFDYNEPNQQANIYVDGKLVGRWYSPGLNQVKRWRDEDFVIPTEFTRGKKNIRIRVEVIVDPAPWSEYYYLVFSLKAELVYLPKTNSS